ncbi:hypothetical protein ACFX2I_026214 [Malus domestica]
MADFLWSLPISHFYFHVLQLLAAFVFSIFKSLRVFILRFMTVGLVLSRSFSLVTPARLSVASTMKFLSAIASDCCEINLGGRLVLRNRVGNRLFGGDVDEKKYGGGYGG